MIMNRSKTRIDVIRREERNSANIKVRGEKMKEISEFNTYLGSMITQARRSNAEVKSRIDQTKMAFL